MQVGRRAPGSGLSVCTELLPSFLAKGVRGELASCRSDAGPLAQDCLWGISEPRTCAALVLPVAPGDADP